MEQNRKFGPTRGSIITIFNELWKIAASVLGVLFINLVSQNGEVLQATVVIIIGFVFKPISKLIEYLSTIYTVTDKSFYVKKGILVKRTIEIPLEVITTVDFGQSLFYQIFKCYKVKIDNASQAITQKDKAEIVLSLSKKDAFYLKELLMEDSVDKQNIKEKNEKDSLNSSVGEIILLGLFSSNILSIIQILAVGVPVLSFFVNLFSSERKIEDFFDSAFEWFVDGNGVRIILLIVGIIVANFVYVIVNSLLRYYPFQVQMNEKEIRVDYGTLSKKSYTFPRKKISGIKRKQSILMRIFGYESLELMVVGYGDTSEEDKVKEVPLLVPIIKVNKTEQILSQLFKNYQEEKEELHADKKGLFYYFLTFRVFGVIILIMASLLIKQLAVCRVIFLLLGLVVMISVFMEYKAARIFISNHYITIAYGSFRTEKKMIPWNKVEAVSGYGSIWKQKAGLISLRLSTNAPIYESSIKAKNYNKKILGKILEKVPF
ncbi:PH domain-containing protein [Anaerosacchariphilus polymeriproducens]|uniref:YdbS-like PH domain-containing protein n=1 Tax=Anaerosacchariphilus polymeriproducens TaxID=1812858 RepID=A0A371AVK2_9FIRM|nr:PH domain-containing protein [Anaerosacchariphilus polymeriproducens]RDU23614.1 hypothetical protein DWV06_08505 [Anaerosacchariphilus polymeriproducens]